MNSVSESYAEGFRVGESYGKEQAEIGAHYAGYQAGVIAERARCAAKCREQLVPFGPKPDNYATGWVNAKNACAAAIEAEPAANWKGEIDPQPLMDAYQREAAASAALDAGVTCDECGGTGKSKLIGDCADCHGTGTVIVSNLRGSPVMNCDACHGTGKVAGVYANRDKLCAACHGTGKISLPQPEPPRACPSCGKRECRTHSCYDVVALAAESDPRITVAVAERQRRIIERAAKIMEESWPAHSNEGFRRIRAMLTEPAPWETP